MVDVTEVEIWGELVGAIRWDQSQQLGYSEFAPAFIQKKLGFSPVFIAYVTSSSSKKRQN